MEINLEPSAHGEKSTDHPAFASDSAPGLSQDYQNYLWVRDQVISVLKEQRLMGVSAPSQYWSEELLGFDYMMEASPKLVQKLRQQSYHLTGIKHYEYRTSQTKLRQSFAEKLGELKKADTNGLFIAESPALGGFGHSIDGNLVNIDTLKFYESLIALDRAGVLQDLKINKHPLVIEIGAGWGGFAYQFLTTCPNSTYVIVDFPEVFLFSATYLKIHFPNRKILIVKNAEDRKKVRENARSYDLIFIPQETFLEVWNQPVDLAINMVSFQEMTTEQVETYARHLAAAGARVLYSHNRDRSKHNAELSTVSEILGRHFSLKRISFLDGDYPNMKARFLSPKKTALNPPAAKLSLSKRAKNKLGRLVKEVLGNSPAPSASSKDSKTPNEWIGYRHLIGTPAKP